MGTKVSAIARLVGKERTYVSHSLRLLRLHPKVREALRNGALPREHALSLIRLESYQQIALAEEVMEKGLTTVETRDRVRRLLGKELKWRLVPIRIKPARARAQTVFKAQDVYPEIAEKVDDGTWSVHRGYTKIRDTIKKQKDVENMKAKISEALSHVKRESLREQLEEKYLSDEADLSKISIRDVKTDIDRELGLHVGPTDLKQWKEIKEKFLKPVNQYKEHSSSREWSSEDRRFLQTLTWMDVGKNIPNRARTGLHKIGTKTVWVLLVR